MAYAISAGHEETLASAKLILDNGGNAFDAAIAAAFTMFISEPCMASAGAGGFAMVRKQGEPVRMLDFFTQTPIAKPTLDKRDFYPIQVDFGNEIEEFHVGLASVATPGIIKGIFELYNNYASLPLKDLIFPAKELAKNGVIMNTFQNIDLELLDVIIKEDPSMKSVFFKKNGDPLDVGERLIMPNLYNFLDMLELEGQREFYHGDISRIVDQVSRERGGYIRRQDFEKYNAEWRKPIQMEAFGHSVYMPNGPSLGGGLMALLLESYDRHKNWIEATIDIRQDFESISSIQGGMNSRLPNLNYKSLDGPASTKGTSHFNIIDKEENVISFSCSIGEGCGYFIPGTDMQLNNMMGESFLLPDGFHSWKEDARLHSMMTPTLVYDKKDVFKYAGGSGGAGRIPYMIAQTLGGLLEYNLDLESAINNPRAYLMHGTVHLESGLSKSLVPSQYSIQEWEDRSLFFGGVHSLAKDIEGRLEAFGDPRRYGVGVVQE